MPTNHRTLGKEVVGPSSRQAKSSKLVACGHRTNAYRTDSTRPCLSMLRAIMLACIDPLV